MKNMSDILRKAIVKSGLSDLNLATQAGVNRQSIARFVSGQTTITLEQAERLAAFLGLELRQIEKAKTKKGHK